MSSSIVFNPFTANFDFVGTGSGPSSGILTINSNAPDGAGNYVLAAATGGDQNAFKWTQSSHTSTLSSNTGSFAVSTVVGVSQAAVAGNIYILTNPSLTTVSLPANGSTTVGDTFKIIGLSGGYQISQAASQQIQIGDESSTAGTGGHVSCSGSIFNAITLMCVTDAGPFIWAAIEPPQGTFTTT